MASKPKPKAEQTSLRINSELWKTAKIEAVLHDMTLGRLVEEAVKDWIERHRKRGDE
jgi:predicted transcriptional regulator